MNPEKQQPKLLFFPLDMHSHILRCLQLAEAIKDVADCIIATEKFTQLVFRRGFAAVSYKALSAEMVAEKGRAGDYSYISPETLEPVIAQQLNLIRLLKPNFVVNDMSFSAHIAAEMAGVPCIALVNGFLSPHLAVARPIPPTNPVAKFAPLIPNFLAGAVEKVILWNLHRNYRRLRKKYQLDNRRKTLFQEFEGDVNLILDPMDFAPQKRLPENSFYLGPIYHVDQKREDEILAKIHPAKKTILVNLGTWNQRHKVRFLNHPDFRKYNIIVVGKDSGELAGPQFIHAEFLSLESVLPKVDLVICQGGTGNFSQSFAHGVPVLCFPSFFEQEWNALRIQEMGYGLSLSGDEAPAKLAEMVEAWVTKKSTLKFRLLKGTANVRDTKLRFRKIVKDLCAGLLRQPQIETGAVTHMDQIEGRC